MKLRRNLFQTVIALCLTLALICAIPVSAAEESVAPEKCVADFVLGEYTGPCLVDLGTPLTSTGNTVLYNGSTICFPLFFIGGDGQLYPAYNTELQGDPAQLFTPAANITSGSASVHCNGWKTWDNGHWYLEYAVEHTGKAADISISVQLQQPELGRESSVISFTGTAPANLLVNPDFEIVTGPLVTVDYNPGAWYHVDCSYHIGNEASHSGTTFAHLLYANNGADTGPFPCLYQDVAVTPNSVYRLTFWARHWVGGDAVPQTLYYGIRNPKGADVWAPVVQNQVTLATDFIYVPITMEFSTGNLDAVRVFAFAPAYSAGGLGGYQLDSYSLEYVRPDRAEVPADGLLKDGSFNNATTVMTDPAISSEGYWTSMSYANTIWEYGNAYAGAGLINMTCSFDGIPADQFPTIYQDVAVEPHSIYNLTFYARNWNPSAPVNPLYYGYRNPLAPADQLFTPVVQLEATGIGSEYQKITLEINTQELTKLRIFAFTQTIAGYAAGYHLDNFLLEYVRPVPQDVPADGLIKDGSFNTPMTVITDGTLSSEGFWTSMSWASSVQEPQNAYAGNGLANLVCSFDGLPAGDFPTIYQDVPVEPYSIYTLSFYARNWNPSAPVNPLYYGYRNPAGDIWVPVQEANVSDLTADYRLITMTIDTKALSKIRVFAFTQAVEGYVAGYHLDNFKLEYVESSAPAELAFSSASLSIANGISVNFKANASLFESYSDPSVTFNIAGKTFTTTDYTVSNDKYVFTLYNIQPDWMGETITATLTAQLDGQTHTAQKEYSVLQYCRNTLDNPESTTALKTLLVDLLNYGAAAQTYTGHNADSLVNAGLSDAEKAMASVDTDAVSCLAIGTDLAEPTAQWKSAALYLRETVRIRLRFTAAGENLSLQAKIGDAVYTVEQADFLSSGNDLWVYFDGLNAYQLRTAVEFTVLSNGTPISNTLTYSAESYAAGVSDPAIIPLMKAMLRYGDAAAAYLASMN